MMMESPQSTLPPFGFNKTSSGAGWSQLVYLILILSLSKKVVFVRFQFWERQQQRFKFIWGNQCTNITRLLFIFLFPFVFLENTFTKFDLTGFSFPSVPPSFNFGQAPPNPSNNQQTPQWGQVSQSSGLIKLCLLNLMSKPITSHFLFV